MRRGDEDDSTRRRQWVEVQISEGSYDLIDIAETIKIAMKRNEHNDESVEITANTNTLKSVLEIQGDFQVDFRARNSIASVLGFRNQVYKEGIHESDSVVNILSINSILVNVDVIGGSYVNGRTQKTIYSFFPNVSPGYKIVENPRNLVYLPVILDKINKMETVVTDQNGKQLNLRGEKVSLIDGSSLVEVRNFQSKTAIVLESTNLDEFWAEIQGVSQLLKQSDWAQIQDFK